MISGCQLFSCDKPAPVASDYSQVGRPLCWLSLSRTWHQMHARYMLDVSRAMCSLLGAL